MVVTVNVVEFISAHADYASLIVFALCIVLFVLDKLPMATTAILGCAVMVVLGIGSFSDAFGSFASSTVVMLVGVLVIGMAMDESGLASKLGNVIVKASKGSERKLMLVSFVVAFLMSTFMTNVSVLAIFIPIIFSLGKSNKQIRPRNLIIPLTLAVNSGGITTLVGSSQQMTAQGLLEEYGYKTFGVFDLAPYGLIVGVLFLLYSLFVGYPLGKRIWGDREDGEYSGKLKEHNTEVKTSKLVSMCVIFALTVFFYIVQKIPFTDIEVKPHITSTFGALACIATGCISQKKAVTELNWDIVGRLAACLGLAKVLESAGGIKLISEGFMHLVGNDMAPFAIFAILVLFSWAVSLVISNSTAISIALLVVISIAPQLGLNVPAYAMGIVFASSMGCTCPLSGSTWGISMAAGYRFKDYLKYGIAVDLLGVAAVLIAVPAIMGLTA